MQKKKLNLLTIIIILLGGLAMGYGLLKIFEYGNEEALNAANDWCAERRLQVSNLTRITAITAIMDSPFGLFEGGKNSRTFTGSVPEGQIWLRANAWHTYCKIVTPKGIQTVE